MRIEILKKVVVILLTMFSVVGISCKTNQKAKPGTDSPDRLSEDNGLKLTGNRFFTLSTVVRVNQIETSRDKSDGVDESSVHGPEEARVFRETIEKSWPGARITWAFSWLALKDQRTNYLDL
jgi:hypothetical protein